MGQSNASLFAAEFPTESSPIGPINPYIKISAGNSSTCSIDKQNRAWCWGLNESGQLGNGTWSINNPEQAVPQYVFTGEVITDISVGSTSVCALTNFYKSLCWGDNTYGELGTGQVVGGGIAIPINVLLPNKGKSEFTKISSGNYYNCALDSKGQAWCWGNNNNGQSGGAGSTIYTTPHAIVQSCTESGSRIYNPGGFSMQTGNSIDIGCNWSFNLSATGISATSGTSKPWEITTTESLAKLEFDTSGNLVATSTKGDIIWTSKTSGLGSKMVLDSSNNETDLKILDVHGKVLCKNSQCFIDEPSRYNKSEGINMFTSYAEVEKFFGGNPIIDGVATPLEWFIYSHVGRWTEVELADKLKTGTDKPSYVLTKQNHEQVKDLNQFCGINERGVLLYSSSPSNAGLACIRRDSTTCNQPDYRVYNPGGLTLQAGNSINIGCKWSFTVSATAISVTSGANKLWGVAATDSIAKIVFEHDGELEVYSAKGDIILASNTAGLGSKIVLGSANNETDLKILDKNDNLLCKNDGCFDVPTPYNKTDGTNVFTFDTEVKKFFGGAPIIDGVATPVEWFIYSRVGRWTEVELADKLKAGTDKLSYVLTKQNHEQIKNLNQFCKIHERGVLVYAGSPNNAGLACIRAN